MYPVLYHVYSDRRIGLGRRGMVRRYQVGRVTGIGTIDLDIYVQLIGNGLDFLWAAPSTVWDLHTGHKDVYTAAHFVKKLFST